MIRVIVIGCALACGGSCPVFVESAFDVTVADSNGKSLCDAIVTASGTQDLVLESLARPDGTCAYHEPSMARPGPYTVTAAAPGHQSAAQTVVVAAGDCGQDSEVALTLTLLETSH